ncbi:MAG TPA: HAMP domain-containing sensor histidine kinase [Anaeromyxobacter sp.]|nr:HAMP domain-containing sensor histidine kinase [Anaeromyxobacter sp.]
MPANGRDESGGEQGPTRAQLLAAARLASLGAMARGMAHEINNPLTSVVSGLQHVASELRDLGALLPADRLDDLRSAVADAQQGARRVRALVGALQAFSRDPGRTQAVELPRVLDLAAGLAAGQLRNRARLVKEYGELPPVAGDEAPLGQVFLNLLLNAAQAIPEGSPGGHEVRIRARPDAAGVEVEIRDTGEGIGEAARARIFEAFYTTRDGEGRGLGLFVSRGLVEAMGGRLRFESAAGRGSSFFVQLPFPPR